MNSGVPIAAIRPFLTIRTLSRQFRESDKFSGLQNNEPRTHIHAHNGYESHYPNLRDRVREMENVVQPSDLSSCIYIYIMSIKG